MNAYLVNNNFIVQSYLMTEIECYIINNSYYFIQLHISINPQADTHIERHNVILFH